MIRRLTIWMVGSVLMAGVLRADQRPDSASATAPATVSGVVTTGDAAATPVSRAVVVVAPDNLSSSYAAITDDDGRFSIGGVPAGRFTVTARKPAYLSAAYGALVPGGEGTPLVLTVGATARVALRMFRGAVIAGTIHDSTGKPRPFCLVAVIRQPGTTPAQTVVADDRGAYRIYGLAPGEYVIAAASSMTLGPSGPIESRTVEQMDAILRAPREVAAGSSPNRAAYAPSYFPGTSVAADAGRVSVAVGEQREGMDFALTKTPTVSLSGIVLGAAPDSQIELAITLGPRMRLPLFSDASPVLTKAPGADGRFQYSNLAPGRYVISARARSAASPPTGAEYGATLVTVDGAGAPETTVALHAGAVLKGQSTFQSPSGPPRDLSQFKIRLSPRNGAGNIGATRIGAVDVASGAPISLAPDGSFAVRDLPAGTYDLSVLVNDATRRWQAVSAFSGDLDALDAGLEVPIDGPPDPVLLRFTDQPSTLDGTLQTAAGQPIADYAVVVFSEDSRYWLSGSRRLAALRPDTEGHFHMANLPPGRYRLAVVTALDSKDLQAPGLLSQLFAMSVGITVAEGTAVTQDLRLGGP